MTNGRGSIKREDDRHTPGPTEQALMVASAVLTLAVLAYVSYHALALPDEPRLTTEVTGYERMASGDVAVHVELTNGGGVGLITVDVSVDCDAPPPTVSFTNVPALAERRGTVVCPPGTTNATATVASWVPV